jgi:hypothetical protein
MGRRRVGGVKDDTSDWLEDFCSGAAWMPAKVKPSDLIRALHRHHSSVVAKGLLMPSENSPSHQESLGRGWLVGLGATPHKSLLRIISFGLNRCAGSGRTTILLISLALGDGFR